MTRCPGSPSTTTTRQPTGSSSTTRTTRPSRTPNLIYPGETLFVPSDPPANFTLSSYVPKHAKPAAPVVTTSTSHHSDSSGSGSHSSGGTVTVQAATQGSHTSSHGGSGSLSGTLGCSGLEQLWDAAGGNPSHAFMAAEIAMAESGGNPNALSPTDDFGYWQINASNGSLATYNALRQCQVRDHPVRRRHQLVPVDHVHRRPVRRPLLSLFRPRRPSAIPAGGLLAY